MIKPDIYLGPPGTGKTTVLIDVVRGALRDGTRPDRIGYLSFTRRAAEEAVTRACAEFGRERGDFPYFRTIHSLCYRLLGLSSSDVMEGKRLAEFGEFAGIEVTGKWSEDGTLNGFSKGDRILFMEHLARIRCVALREQFDIYDDDLRWHEVSRVARALREFKAERSLVDYTDMLLQFCEVGTSPPLDMLLVDETQDLSQAQWRVVWKLVESSGCKRVIVAGDDDQAIYRWAGADVDYFVALQGRVRVLSQSWRVPVRVQRAASQAISAVRRRRPKTWNPRNEDGIVDRAPNFENADISGQEILVLARNEYILREQVIPELRRAGVFYERAGHPSVRQKVINAIVTWEALRRGESVLVEQARAAYEFLSGGVGVARGFKSLPDMPDDLEVDMAALREKGGLLADGPWFEALDRVPASDVTYVRAALRHGDKLNSKPRIRISTIHGSKGGQADHVILMTEMASRTHREMLDNPEDEARVWYVGATRAKQRLTIVGATTNRRCPWL